MIQLQPIQRDMADTPTPVLVRHLSILARVRGFSSYQHQCQASGLVEQWASYAQSLAVFSCMGELRSIIGCVQLSVWVEEDKQPWRGLTRSGPAVASDSSKSGRITASGAAGVDALKLLTLSNPGK